jgi:hypothetical protein
MDLIFVFYLILIYSFYYYLVFEKSTGTVSLSLLNIIFSFFVLLHLMIDFSIRSVYLVGFLMLFMVSIIGIVKGRGRGGE